jgi:hypothetical protein
VALAAYSHDNGAENASFCAILIMKRSFCQDRLGTNIGKEHSKQRVAFPAGGSQEGNLFFELNRALRLRKRGQEQRTALIDGWGVYMHYIMAAMAKLPKVEGVCYRGYPDKAVVLAQYKPGRPVQWGAFASTSTDFEITKGFTIAVRKTRLFAMLFYTNNHLFTKTGSGQTYRKLKTKTRFLQATGVIFKLTVTDGRDVNAFSFFPNEAEVLLSPQHRFHVSSAPYDCDGYTVIDMVQDAGCTFVS